MAPRHQAKKQRLLEAEPDTSAPVADNQCEVCGFVAKTAGGLTAHQRSHKEG